MGRIKRCILLSLCILLSVVVRAQERGEAVFSLQERADGTILVDFTMGTVSINPAGDDMVSLDCPGMVSLAPRAGLPALPQTSRLLALPRGSRLTAATIEVLQRQETTLADGSPRTVTPYAGATAKDMPPATTEPDKEVYGMDGVYRAGEPIEIEDLGAMGDRQLFRITVHAAEYRPSASQITLLTAITATLTPTEAPLSTAAADGLHEKYLIVSRPQFHEGLQPFARWKRQEGFEVTEIYAETSSPDSVKALIASHFGSAMRWPRYLLLVGDADQLQPFEGATTINNQTHHTDLYFAEHTGDYLPDALVGRWPVNDAAELEAVVEKTIRYEQGLGLDPAALGRVLLVAGKEEHSPAPVTTNGHVNYVGNEIALSHPDIDTVCHRNPASNDELDSILGTLADGITMLSYTAHCTATGWSHPAVTFATLDTVEVPQPPVYINNCCLSNAFDDTCFGELLLRKAGGGAVGVIGATNSTLWNEDYYWAVGPKYPLTVDPPYDPDRSGAFDRWLGRSANLQTLGDLLAAGNMAVSAFGSPYAKFYWEIYCLLGDPSLIPFVGVPQEATVSLSNPLRVGDNEVRLQVPVGMLVSVVQNDSLLGVGFASDDGETVITLNSSVDTGAVIITATDRHPGFTPAGRNYQLLPHADTLRAADAVTALGLYHIALTDSSIQCQVANLGSDRLFGITVGLLTDASAPADATVIAATTAVIDTLAPQARKDITIPYSIATVGQQARWQALLTAAVGTEHTAVAVSHAMPIAYPTAAFRMLKPSLVEAHRLSPLQDYILETSVDGDCDSLRLIVTVLPSGDTLTDTISQLSLLNCQFTTPDTITHLHITATLSLGSHSTVQDHYLVAEPRTESFEELFGSYPWQTGGTNGWYIDSTVAHSGHFSARSGAIEYRQTSELRIDAYVPYWDTIIYWARSSSELDYDKLSFSVDGVPRPSAELSGTSNQWWRYKYAVRPGHHTFSWRYTKDESGTAGSDCVWLDDIRLPLALWDAAYGWFPVDTVTPPIVIDIQEAEHSTPRLSPNPTNGLVTVSGIGQPATVLVSDLYGHTVYSAENRDGMPLTFHLDAADGIYFVQVRTADSLQAFKLILKQ